MPITIESTDGGPPPLAPLLEFQGKTVWEIAYPLRLEESPPEAPARADRDRPETQPRQDRSRRDRL